MSIEQRYDVKAKSSRLTYEFNSEGPVGIISKRVQFELYVEELKIYNLALGDVGEDNKLNDDIRSNNSDTLKVLATVAFCVFDFFGVLP